MKNIIIICIVMMAFLACEKGPGEGGTSVIEGNIIYFERTFDPVTLQTDTHYYPKSGKDVFIIYSDNESEFYDDKFETDYNGRYHFEFLRKGRYIIYTHKDTTIETGIDSEYDYEIPIYQSVKISSDNSVNMLEDFIIENN
jgi:hypothetical protein